MSVLRDLADDVFGRVDATLLAGVYTSVSVSPGRVRSGLRAAGRPFVDPGAPSRPRPEQVDRTARWVVGQSGARLAVFGGLAGIGGAASVPPEARATTVAGLRLAQRLAIVYGFDPSTDRGELAVWKALAAGFDVPLPGDGPVGMRVSELPGVLVPRRRPQRGGALAAAVVRESAWMVASRLPRLLPIPLLSNGISARAARRRLTAIGERMIAVLRRLADAPEPDPAMIVDAVEVA